MGRGGEGLNSLEIPEFVDENPLRSPSELLAGVILNPPIVCDLLVLFSQNSSSCSQLEHVG